MVIQHNLAAINNLNIGNRVQKGKFKATERLASGNRINRAADDAAGLAISEKMRARMKALAQVQNNIEDGISLTQTADGALAEVNAMLNRVQELCVQAANGTNTEEDRMMLEDEITQLYDAMEAVFTDTEFNTMPIFRHDGANFYAGRPRYNYTETVTWLPEGDYASWGDELLGITDKTFDASKDAVAASATILLDDTIDVSDSASFVGKNLRIGNCYFQFVDSSNGDKTGLIQSGNGEYYINIDTQNRTVQQVLGQLASGYNSRNGGSRIDTVSVTKSSDGKNALKIVMQKTSLSPSCTIDGTTIQYPAISDGNGSSGNNIVISSKEDATLEEVDTAGNALSFDSSATVTFSLLGGTGPITAEEIASFQNNTFYIQIGSTRHNIPVGASITDGMTKEQVRSAFVDALNGLGNGITASVSGSDVTVTVTSQSASKMESVYIGDSVNTQSSNVSGTTTALPFKLTHVAESTPESVDIWSLTIDDTTALDFPVTCQIGTRTLTVFDRAELSPGSNTAGMQDNGIVIVLDQPDKSKVLDYLRIYIPSYISDAVVTKSGNTLTIKSKTANTDLNLNEKLIGKQVDYTEKIQYADMLSTQYFEQNYAASVDLNERMSSGFDVTALYGSGFYLNGVSYEFSDASAELTNENTVRIDISGCNDYEAIAQKAKTVVQAKDNCIYDVTEASGVLTISGTKTTYNYSYGSDMYKYFPAFSDGKTGEDGLMNNEAGLVSVTTSGGKDMSRPQTAIDFSGVNLDNMSELYGKGFRITCATCPGEFVNIIFCHDKDQANFPEKFEYTDEDGNQNIIKNHVVELKNITSGSEIVDSIAQQLQGSLEHTITVEASGEKLIVMDKRYGDITDKETGALLQAKILAGVYTNCTYHVDADRIVDKSELVGDGRADTDAYYAFVMIYAGDTEEKPYIPIHLPYLSLEHLKLEYPGDSFRTYDGITEVMRRSKTAASVISMARSKIGADQNRLEHAFQYAANAEEQVTAAYSRIHDADMAEEAVNQAKYKILAEVQQAMLSQIYRQPEQVLSLLR